MIRAYLRRWMLLRRARRRKGWVAKQPFSEIRALTDMRIAEQARQQAVFDAAYREREEARNG